MALTSTNGTGTVSGSDVIFTINGTGEARGNGVISYIDYTKGANDLLTLSAWFQNTDIDANWYRQVIVVNQVITVVEMDLSFSDTIRLPLPVSLAEEKVKITTSGLVDGDLNIEYAIDSRYF